MTHIIQTVHTLAAKTRRSKRLLEANHAQDRERERNRRVIEWRRTHEHETLDDHVLSN